MARKKKTAASESVQEQAKIHYPSEKEFLTTCKKIKVAEGQKNEGVSEMGAIVANAVEKFNLDKRARSIYARLDRLDPAKLAVTLAHLKKYIAYGKLQERADEQMTFLNEDEQQETEQTNGRRRPRVVAGQEHEQPQDAA